MLQLDPAHDGRMFKGPRGEQVDDAREECPHDRHEREALPRQHGAQLQLVRDPENIHNGEGHEQVFRPAQQDRHPPAPEARDGKLPPRRRQQLQRVRVRHRPDDEDGRDADAQQEAEQRPPRGQQRDLRDGRAECRDEEGQQAEQDARVGHVDLVQLDHVVQDAVDVRITREPGLALKVCVQGRGAGGRGDVGEFGAEEGEEFVEAGGASEVRLDVGEGGEEGEEGEVDGGG